MEILWGPPRAGNQGLVICTGGGAADLLHELPVGRTAKIITIMAYAPAANGTLSIGTLTNAAVFAARFPLIAMVAGFTVYLIEAELPPVEFVLDTTAGAAGVTGDIYVVSSVANFTVLIGVREKAS